MADIVDTAATAGNFTKFFGAIEAVGRLGVLRDVGPFTAFVPTDEAFAKLPAGTLEQLLTDHPKLIDILTYHVAPGKFMAADIMKVDSVTPFSSVKLTIGHANGVTVDSAKVVQADIVGDNGVIHAIDTVLIPSTVTL